MSLQYFANSIQQDQPHKSGDQPNQGLNVQYDRLITHLNCYGIEEYPPNQDHSEIENRDQYDLSEHTSTILTIGARHF